jgi:putative ABC transport system permease protein
MESFSKDIRYGVRSLLKRPAFTIVAAITLALGIGANTTIFSVVNGILLRPLPGISRPDRLLDVHATSPNGSSFHSFSHPEFLYYREHTTRLDGLIAYTGVPFNMNTGGQPERVYGMLVSGNYFDVLRTTPARGRFFLPEEDQTPGTHPVVVLSFGLWQQRFGSNPDLVGKNITLNGRSFLVIGVAPESFAARLRD